MKKLLSVLLIFSSIVFFLVKREKPSVGGAIENLCGESPQIKQACAKLISTTIDMQLVIEKPQAIKVMQDRFQAMDCLFDIAGNDKGKIISDKILIEYIRANSRMKKEDGRIQKLAGTFFYTSKNNPCDFKR